MFADACALLDAALTTDFRRRLVDEIPRGKGLGDALGRLRHAFRSHALNADRQRIDLAPIVARYDKQTRKEGFHVLHDWDGKADHVNRDTIPVDVLNFLINQRATSPAD